MGPQRVLQAAVALAIAAGPAAAAPAARERIAVIDLGDGPGNAPSNGPSNATADAAQRLRIAVAAAGFDPVVGDGVEDALAGRDVDRDAVTLAAAMASAERAFGALSCGEVVPAARQAIAIAAARQAAGRPVPELPRAWAYLLLCADRDGKIDAALAAAGQLRALGGSPDVPAAVWAKYPEVDAIADRELVALDIDADVPGAAIWIDFRPAGTAPLHVELAAGEHVVAAAAGSKRGSASGTAVRSQTSLRVPLAEAAGPWADVAARVASWRELPPPDELAQVLARVRARVALIRRGDALEVWGQAGRSEAPHRLGGEDGAGPLADVGRVLGVAADRIRAWADHAPDPDRPLLVEDPATRTGRREDGDRPTPWWVYAAIGGAVAVAATIILVHDAASDRQRVELHYP